MRKRASSANSLRLQHSQPACAGQTAGQPVAVDDTALGLMRRFELERRCALQYNMRHAGCFRCAVAACVRRHMARRPRTPSAASYGPRRSVRHNRVRVAVLERLTCLMCCCHACRLRRAVCVVVCALRYDTSCRPSAFACGLATGRERDACADPAARPGRSAPVRVGVLPAPQRRPHALLAP